MANNKDFVVKGLVEINGTAKQKTGTVSSSSSTVTVDNISQATVDNFKVGNFYGISFNSDGTYIYYVTTSRIVHQYALSTAWDTTTIASTATNTLDVSATLPSLYDMCFNSNGTKMYLLDFNNDTIYQYGLTTAYDISTASYDSKTFSYGAQAATAFSISLHNDNVLLVGSYSNSRVDQYSLSTDNDISTASYVGSTASVAGMGAVVGCSFNSDGTKLYTSAYDAPIQSFFTIYEFSVSTAYDVTTASFVAKNVPPRNSGAYTITLKPDDSYLYDGAGIRYSFSKTTNTFDLDLSTGTIFAPVLSGNSNITLSNPPTIGTQNFIINADTSAASTYDLLNTPYTPVSAKNSNTEIYVKDSTTWYAMAESTAFVYQYSMTDFDLSTTASVNSSRLNDSADAEYRGGFTFKPDGSKIFLMGSYYKRLSEFTLSTPWDVTSHTYVSYSTYSPSGVNDARGFQFKPDGTRFFILYRKTGNTESIVYQFDLSTAWSYTGGTANGSYDLGTVVGNTLGFSDDGTKMFVLSLNDDGHEYALSTPWDVTTASLTGTRTGFKGDSIAIGNEGKLLFRTDYTFLTSHNFGNSITETWPSGFNWQNGTQPELTSPSKSFSAFTPDGGTTYLVK